MDKDLSIKIVDIQSREIDPLQRVINLIAMKKHIHEEILRIWFNYLE